MLYFLTNQPIFSPRRKILKLNSYVCKCRICKLMHYYYYQRWTYKVSWPEGLQWKIGLPRSIWIYIYIYIKINYFLTFDFINENKSWFKCVIFLLTKSSLSMRCIPPCDTSKGMQNVVYTVSKSVNFWYQQEWSLMWCLRSDLLKKTAVFLFHSFLVLN